MNIIGMNMYPAVTLLEENKRELERELQLRRQIREAREARRAQRPSRFAALATRLRRAPRPAPCPPAVEGCQTAPPPSGRSSPGLHQRGELERLRVGRFELF